MNSGPDEIELFVLLHDVARLIRIEADRRARGLGMTLTQWKLLVSLERRPGLTQKEAADFLEVEPISVARLVDRLEASQMVERRPDAEDRRVWRLHLRPAAAGALRKIQAIRSDMADDIARDIEPNTLAALRAGLQQMRINLTQPAQEPIKESA